MNKRRSQQKHTSRRVAERFGVNFSEAAQRDLIRQIQNDEAEFVAKQSNRVSIFKTQIKGKDAWVAYDKLRGSIATILNEPPRIM